MMRDVYEQRGFLSRGKPRQHFRRTNIYEQYNSFDEYEKRRGRWREGLRCGVDLDS